MTSAGVFHPLTRVRMPTELSYLAAVRELREGRHKGERILLVFAGGSGHAIHYFLQDAGATVVGKPRRVTDSVAYEVGGARLTAIGLYRVEMEGAPPIDVKAGDVVWLLNRFPGETPDTEASIVSRMPPGLSLGQRARMTDAPMLWTYRVEGVTP
jgi:hypothetical protein